MRAISRTPALAIVAAAVILLAAATATVDAAVIELFTVEDPVDGHFQYPGSNRDYVVVTPNSYATFRAVLRPVPGQTTANVLVLSSVPHLISNFEIVRNTGGSAVSVEETKPIGSTGTETVIRLHLDSPIAAGFAHEQEDLWVIVSPSPPTSRPGSVNSSIDTRTTQIGRCSNLWMRIMSSQVPGATWYQHEATHLPSRESFVHSSRESSMPYSNQFAGCVDIADGDPVRFKSRGCNARGCGPWSESRTIQLSLGRR